jgi:hypothetical protein
MDFHDMYIPEPNSGCFLWLGNTTASGHGTWKGKIAHRYVCEGLSEEKPLALHKCDVACCVNPLHLFPGNQKDNMQDMVRKGRHKGGRWVGYTLKTKLRYP